MRGFIAGKQGVISRGSPVSARRASARMGDCPDGNGCPAGYRRVFGQCILDVPSAVFGAPVVAAPVLMGGSFGKRW